MKFSVLVSIVSEEFEEKALKTAKDTGAGGVTILKGKGIGNEEKKIFFGLTYEGHQSVLIYVLERKLALKILKKFSQDNDLEDNSVTFTLPIEHLTGINLKQLIKFEDQIKTELMGGEECS
ncbi:MAG: transcriptional regulator [Nitrospinae bacterium]|nr:transcriptional regulator [Nitrospinota bacterium]